MKNILELIEELGLESQITLEEIPHIDLYMDQVIQLFENKYNGSKRNDEEKVLTKTMINNYAKGKLFFPIKNKKYSRDHLILISLIYQFKGALSINDIKESLSVVNSKIVNEDFEIDRLYESFLHLTERNLAAFKIDVEEKAKNVKEEVKDLNDSEHVYLEKFLMIAALVNMSNLYRRVAEKLVDELHIE